MQATEEAVTKQLESDKKFELNIFLFWREYQSLFIFTTASCVILFSMCYEYFLFLLFGARAFLLMSFEDFILSTIERLPLIIFNYTALFTSFLIVMINHGKFYALKITTLFSIVLSVVPIFFLRRIEFFPIGENETALVAMCFVGMLSIFCVVAFLRRVYTASLVVSVFCVAVTSGMFAADHMYARLVRGGHGSHIVDSSAGRATGLIVRLIEKGVVFVPQGEKVKLIPWSNVNNIQRSD